MTDAEQAVKLEAIRTFLRVLDGMSGTETEVVTDLRWLLARHDDLQREVERLHGLLLLRQAEQQRSRAEWK